MSGYCQTMRKFLIGAAIVAVLFAAAMLMGMAQNEGCLPWQEPVGTKGSPFAGTEDARSCR
jgi:hypothetical protein